MPAVQSILKYDSTEEVIARANDNECELWRCCCCPRCCSRANTVRSVVAAAQLPALLLPAESDPPGEGPSAGRALK